MKWLFYLLALLNAGVLALQHWYLPPPEPRPAEVVVPAQSPAPRLVLVAELARPPEARAAVKPVPQSAPVQASAPPSDGPPGPSVPVAPAACYRVSGLPDEAQADALAGRLRRLGAEIRGRHLQQEVETRYWVSLPPFPSRAAAEPTIRRLQRAGIRDHYFVTTDPSRQNAISLGVFSNRKGAERRRAQIARLGFSPRVEPVEAPKKVYALTLALPAERSLKEFDLGQWADGVEETPCP